MGLKNRGKLVWAVNGREIVIVPSAPFPLLQRERQRLRKESAYQKGKLLIRYLFT